jgi:glycosyltransferase involved in cell wall biosynthesis
VRVALINTTLDRGGASKACRRLQNALEAAGAATVFVCRRADGPLDRAVATREPGGESFIHDLRAPGSGWFSIASRPVGLAARPEFAQADAINLHWVADYLAPADVAGLAALGKPLVWTFHDYWPMTGGCHYPGGCDGFTRDCRDCPQLAPEAAAFAAWSLAEKKRLFRNLPIVAVSPSRFLAEDIRRSAVFGGKRVEVIANPADLETFAPGVKSLARRRLGLPRRTILAAFSSHRLGDPRKGLGALCAALARLAGELPDASLGGEPKLAALCLGEFDFSPLAPEVPLILAGAVDDERRLAAYYQASDVCVLPTLQDNLPNTVIESLACGTPVAAYDTGGIAEILDDPLAGELVPAGDVPALASALKRRLTGPGGRPDSAAACRELAVRKYRPGPLAGAYLELFADMAATAKSWSGWGPARDADEPYPGLAAAAGVCQRLSDRRRDLKDGLIAQAFVLRDLKRPAECAAVVDSLDAGKGGPENLRFKACLLAGAGEHGQAIEIFGRLLEDYPWRVDIALNLADALRYAGRLVEAGGLLEDLGARFPGAAGLDAAWAKLHLARGEKRKAARCCARALRRHGDPWARSCLIGLLGELGKPALAARL